jgi:hypothetical protein
MRSERLSFLHSGLAHWLELCLIGVPVLSGLDPSPTIQQCMVFATLLHPIPPENMRGFPLQLYAATSHPLLRFGESEDGGGKGT